MISPARKLACRLLHQIEEQRLFSDDAVNSPDMEVLDLRDRRLVTEIVYGTLRWQGTLDYVLAQCSTRPWTSVAPGARILLRMSLYQLWKMSRIPDHALVNDAVELAKRELKKGIDKYVNGMLRNLTRNRFWKEEGFLKDAPEWVQAAMPQWLWNRWKARFGRERAQAFALSLTQKPRAAFRFIGAEDPFVAATAETSDIVPDAFFQLHTGEEPDESATKNRCIQYQDEASQLIPHLPGPIRPHSLVWDACASPGGKSAILSKILAEPGRIISSDISFERTKRMAELLKYAGADPLILIADAGFSPPFRDCFDVVLADVPCSGLGTVRRNPEIKWRFTPEDFAALQDTQKRILQQVAAAVRPGGYLLYSTCSTEPEENEQVVLSFLKTNPDFQLVIPVHPAGIADWIGKDRMVRTFPSVRLWDGFFAALLQRRQEQAL